MTIIKMNKHDMEYCRNNTWIINGKIVYEGIDGKIKEGSQPYDLGETFYSATENEIAQYIATFGFPWGIVFN